MYEPHAAVLSLLMLAMSVIGVEPAQAVGRVVRFMGSTASRLGVRGCTAAPGSQQSSTTSIIQQNLRTPMGSLQ